MTIPVHADRSSSSLPGLGGNAEPAAGSSPLHAKFEVPASARRDEALGQTDAAPAASSPRSLTQIATPGAPRVGASTEPSGPEFPPKLREEHPVAASAAERGDWATVEAELRWEKVTLLQDVLAWGIESQQNVSGLKEVLLEKVGPGTLHRMTECGHEHLRRMAAQMRTEQQRAIDEELNGVMDSLGEARSFAEFAAKTGAAAYAFQSRPFEDDAVASKLAAHLCARLQSAFDIIMRDGRVPEELPPLDSLHMLSYAWNNLRNAAAASNCTAMLQLAQAYEPLTREEGAHLYRMLLGSGPRLNPEMVREATWAGLPLQLVLGCATHRIGDPPMREMQSDGATNTVYDAVAALPDGTAFPGVFKPNDPRQGADVNNEAWLAKSGVDRTRPNWSVRNLAASRIAERLGLEVVPRTHLVLVESKYSAEVGCIMERARGAPPFAAGDVKVSISPDMANALRNQQRKLARVVEQTQVFKWAGVDNDGVLWLSQHREGIRTELDLTNPTLRRELTQLQWLDGIYGQGDRHDTNYFIDAEGHVKGFDNDRAFSPLMDNPEIMSEEVESPYMAWLPRVIDRQTAGRVMALERADVAAACVGLTHREVEATWLRVRAAQAKIRTFESGEVPRAGCIVENDDEWAGDEVGHLLGVPGEGDEISLDTKAASYVARIAAVRYTVGRELLQALL